MNVHPSEHSNIELHPMLPATGSRDPGVVVDSEDRYARVGSAKGLARYIPAKSLRAQSVPRAIAGTSSLMAFLPQYRFTARPTNRLLGGPVQPMSSSMGSSFVTDLIWHQVLPAIAGAALGRTVSPFLNFRPNPFFSTAFACTWGIPVGLYKLGYFQQSLNVQKLALQLSNNHPMLAREIGKLLKASMNPKEFPQVGEAMLRFIREHEEALPAELIAFTSAIEAGDSAALTSVNDLLTCALAYASDDDGYEFAEGVRRLNAIVPISTDPWDVNDESKLLLKDGAKVGVLIGLMAAEWAVWGVSIAHGDARARISGISGGIILGMMVALLGVGTAASKFAQRSHHSIATLQTSTTIEILPDGGDQSAV